MSAGAPSTPPVPRPSPGGQARAWIHRILAAILVPALFFLGLEAVLRVAGVGRSVRFLIPDEKPGYLRTNPEFVASFLPSSFDLRPLNFRIPARKEPGSLRIVVLGESAAQGIPTPSFGFAAQLRAQLRARYPGRPIEVINTGIVAINSHVVYQVAREMARLSPDLFVVYLGNNEVVGPYGPGCAYLSEMPPLWLIRLSFFVRSTRTGQLAGALLQRVSGARRRPPEWGGMSMFADSAVAGDDPRLEVVYRNFEGNLRDIVHVASASGAQTLLCTVASNLKDCAPLLSLRGRGLGPAENKQWDALLERGRTEWRLGEADPARRDLLQALSLDPHYADTSFMLGCLDLQAGNVDSARRYLVDAEHWDALRFRPDQRINAVIREVARNNAGNVRLVDTALLLGSDPESSTPPAGRELFFEHVHPDWEGNYRLARMMAEAAEAALYGSPAGSPSWLDSAGCAAALAYTPHERLGVLEKVETIVANPPFTNQLTYVEDEARLARDLALAKADRADPQKLRSALEVVRAASIRDPGNADLAKIEEEIDDDMGDLAGALAQARRAQDLQPRSFALATDEAIKLSRLGRFDEAEALLRTTARACPPRELAAMAPAFADLFTRTRRFGEGKSYLNDEIATRPDDLSLRYLCARLERLSGDTASAEREYRAILALAPGDTRALEELVGSLASRGLREQAERESMDAAPSQPRNFANNLRSAVLFDERGDYARAITCLLAAERSGPVTSGVEVRLAQRLYGAGRLDEALTHLALARKISLFESDPAETASIGRAIENLEPQVR